MVLTFIIILFLKIINRLGGTASWKDNRQPDKNIAGVQNLIALVNYPGISTPLEVPVKVWVYNFDFTQPIYKIQVGDTFPKGTWAITNILKMERDYQ